MIKQEWDSIIYAEVFFGGTFYFVEWNSFPPKLGYLQPSRKTKYFGACYWLQRKSLRLLEVTGVSKTVPLRELSNFHTRVAANFSHHTCKWEFSYFYGCNCIMDLDNVLLIRSGDDETVLAATFAATVSLIIIAEEED